MTKYLILPITCFIIATFALIGVCKADMLIYPGSFPSLQDAFNSLVSGDTLLISRGTYTLSDGLAIQGKSNIKIIGTGQGKAEAGVKIRLTGDPAKNLIDIVAASSIHFEDIGFYGNNSNVPADRSNIGAYIRRGAGYTSDISFTRCHFRYFAIGSQVGSVSTLESNNENMQFTDCEWSNCAIGYRQYYPNALNNELRHPSFHNNDIDIELGGNGYHGGSLILYNANFAVTSIKTINFVQPARLEIYSFRAESTPQFIGNTGLWGSTAHNRLLLTGGTIINQTNRPTWGTASTETPDTPIIDWPGGGITATDCIFGQYTEAPYSIWSNYYQASNVFTGCTFGSSMDFVKFGISDPTNHNQWFMLSGGPLGTGGIGNYQLTGCMQWNGAGYDTIRPTEYKHIAFMTLAGATPSCANGGTKFVLQNGSPTLVTNITDGYPGLELTLFIPDANTTIVNGTFRNKSGANYTAIGVYKYTYFEGFWWEV